MRIVIAIVVTAAVCLGAAFLLLGNREAPEETENEEAEVEEEIPAEPAEIYEVGQFLVNVNSADQLRYLRIEVALSVRGYGAEDEDAGGGHGGHGGHGGGDDEAEELPKLKAPDEATVRDAIVRVLSNQTYEQLRQDTGHRNVKEELRSELENVFADGEVVDVLFLSFVMQ